MHIRFNAISATLLALTLVAGNADAQAKKKKAPKPVAPKVMKHMDADIAAVGGTGVPVGYLGRTDQPTQKLADAKYVRIGTGWDIATGPAHLLWNPKDAATGSYTVTATIDQLAKPAHPEGYGLFVGGSDLSGPNQAYTYFLVRGTGEMFAKVRSGDKLTGKIAWQKSNFVPAEDASGKASYKLGIQVTADSLRFWVNDHQVAAIAKGDAPTDGLFGIRVNHNLRVHATPVSITRQ